MIGTMLLSAALVTGQTGAALPPPPRKMDAAELRNWINSADAADASAPTMPGKLVAKPAPAPGERSAATPSSAARKTPALRKSEPEVVVVPSSDPPVVVVPPQATFVPTVGKVKQAPVEVLPTAFAAETPKPIEITAQVLPPPAAPAAAEAPAAAAAGPDRWWTMRELQGTWMGAVMDNNRLSISGWTEGSYTASTASINNQPVVWNDRANEFLLQQHWIRLERSVVTSGTTEPSWGFRFDTLTGSDYRFSIPRGLLNEQLMNSTGAQNLYGVDLIQHYVNVYIPTMFQGTEFRIGRLYTPWGVESLEAVSTPLPSRSYAFNWSPPFTHFGLGAYTTYSPKWSSVLMLVNGNDIYLGDTAQEMRFVGAWTWKQPGGRNNATFATSIGRGVFNQGAPFAPNTVSLPLEPLGRNNFNAFDLVWNHTINSRLTYSFEGIYAYQAEAPDIYSPTGFGTASWASAAHYLFYTVSPRCTGILRYENFDDAVAQRTGFPGVYTAITGGAAYKFRKGLIFRPELRYDYNGEATPFEGKHDLFTATADFIVRW